MKNKYLLTGITALSVVAATVTVINFNKKNQLGEYQPREALAPRLWAGAEDIYRRLRADETTGEYNVTAILQARKRIQTSSFLKKGVVFYNWEDMGPDNVGGRTRAVVVDKDNTSIVYTGSQTGGIWKSTDGGSTWSHVKGFNDNNVIGSMAQLGNGKMLVGTGSKHESTASGSGDSRFPGNGLYISSDMVNYDHATDNTGAKLKPTLENTSNSLWTRVNEIVADPRNPNGAWIAYNGGLIYYDTESKVVTKVTTIGNGESEEVAISADGLTLLTIVAAKPWISRDGGANWELVNKTGQIATANIGRGEFSISRDDKNFMYACIAGGSGLLNNVYGSEDNGVTWKVIMPGTTDRSRDPFAVASQGQGTYDNEIEAIPGSPREAIVGGVTLWKVGLDKTAAKIANNFGSGSTYVHSDIHKFTFDKNGVLYIGCDGGIHKSINKAASFTTNNKGYNVTQFYEMAHSGKDLVMGGAQDNGTQYMRKTAGSELSAISVLGGDGFDVEISNLNSNILFACIYNGDIRRSSANGGSMSTFFETSSICKVATTPNGCSGLGGFYTTFRLYENGNDSKSQDSLNYTNNTGRTLNQGEEIEINSLSKDIKFMATMPSSVPNGATVKVQDKVSSIFAAGFTGNQGVWITRGALKFGGVTSPQWWKVMTLSNGEDTKSIEFTPDGSTMFVSTWSGRLYRVVGLDEAWTRGTGNIDSLNTRKISFKSIFSSVGALTGISVDPKNPDHVVVTRGGYSSTPHVYESFNALSVSPTFTAIQGDLPAMPVYDVCIDKDNSEMITVATEFGVFVSINAGANWAEANDGDMNRSPVFGVTQQTRENKDNLITNNGFYYLSTHGRGIMKSESRTVGINKNGEKANSASLTVYPNPMANSAKIQLNSKASGKVSFKVFNLQGQLIRDTQLVVSAGTQTIDFDASDLQTGTYIMQLTQGAEQQIAKFVVSK